VKHTESPREVIPSTPSSPGSNHSARGNSSRKGDLAEYYAVTWLWDNGYEVFKNAGCSGPIDMIAMDNKGEIILIDVKTAQLERNDRATGYFSGHPRTKRQIKLGVRILLFNPSNRALRFVEHKE
jgi:Holliday junction resolvase-like predicted endonuclease